MNDEFQDWHWHDHFHERLGIPGFSRAKRWSSVDGGEVVLQVCELDVHRGG